MARYTGPTTRINRRFSMAIFPPNKAFERKKYLPGVHGPRLRRKVSDYGTGLNEKQKMRYMYGMTEKQFRRSFERAKHMRGVTGEEFQRLLEIRLDNTVYMLGMARTRAAARQIVSHGHIKVNGQKVDIPSFEVKPGDLIEARERTKSKRLATQGFQENQARALPGWLSRDEEALRGTVNRLPEVAEMEQGINLQIIVEFYSR
jgi:small subunit ribosomal protein S4